MVGGSECVAVYVAVCDAVRCNRCCSACCSVCVAAKEGEEEGVGVEWCRWKRPRAVGWWAE